jgi:hypothetical protein
MLLRSELMLRRAASTKPPRMAATVPERDATVPRNPSPLGWSTGCCLSGGRLGGCRVVDGLPAGSGLAVASGAVRRAPALFGL